MFCMPSNPRQLFDDFWMTWTDDMEQKALRQGTELTEIQKRTMVLLDLETKLQSFEKRLEDFGLPVPSEDELAQVSRITCTEPAVIREELQYEIEELVNIVDERVPTFTPEQSAIYDYVMEAVNSNKPTQLFIDARGGCGKTYLLNTILSAVRSKNRGNTALAMATTGIAANLLELGRTYHSRMKAPLDPTETSTLGISAQSVLAKLIRTSKLMMIDEATMLDRYQLEAMDRSLRDLMGLPDKPFGGKILILAGDFRQCLPVVPGANRAGTIKHCINQSDLWRHFQLFKLTTNMRVMASDDPILQQFDKWTLSIGNGEMAAVEVPEAMIATKIPANSKSNPQSEGIAMKQFCQKVFPNMDQNIEVQGWLDGRAILAPTNKEVAILNEVISEMIPGNELLLKSSDELDNSEDLLRFNVEYLNCLTPSGFPPHCLRLKPKMPLMLLRNLDPKQGLCNGTKLIFLQTIDNKLLRCKLVSGKEVLIPRIVFIPKVGEYPFQWQRRQFPVKLAFAMTINKSQGQTLKCAGN